MNHHAYIIASIFINIVKEKGPHNNKAKMQFTKTLMIQFLSFSYISQPHSNQFSSHIACSLPVYKQNALDIKYYTNIQWNKWCAENSLPLKPKA